MTRARVLLLVPAATYRAGDFLLAANRLELDVVIGSDGAVPIGDQVVVRVDPDDLEQSVDRLVPRVGALDAVVAADTPMLPLAAAVSARMDLCHNSVHSVAAATSKVLQRRLWAAAGIPQPLFRVVPAGTDYDTLATLTAEVGFPCVVKPVSLSRSRGVLRADDLAGVASSVRRVRGVLAEAGRPNDEPLLVEEYLSGPEVSVDGLLRDGSLMVTAMFDKPDSPAGPTFEETLLVTPSRLPDRVLASVIGTAGPRRARPGAPTGPHPRGAAHARPRRQSAAIDARARGTVDRRSLLTRPPLPGRYEP